ncbi:MAG: DUF2752 domain-containing protein [Lachnospiraceae bacterium]|nr:DUF2752 domain-containing protein [Lachnospiraceae bacterium]
MSRLEDYCKKKNLRDMDIEHLWMYRICLIMLPFVVIAILFFIIFGNKITGLGTECSFRKMTGLYCIGCGGTRALNYFAHLHFLKSLYYHPFVIYAFTAYILFILNSFLYRHHKKCIEKLNPFVLLYVGLGILFVNFLVKNILLLCGIMLI